MDGWLNSPTWVRPMANNIAHACFLPAPLSVPLPRLIPPIPPRARHCCHHPAVCQTTPRTLPCCAGRLGASQPLGGFHVSVVMGSPAEGGMQDEIWAAFQRGTGQAGRGRVREHVTLDRIDKTEHCGLSWHVASATRRRRAAAMAAQRAPSPQTLLLGTQPSYRLQKCRPAPPSWSSRRASPKTSTASSTPRLPDSRCYCRMRGPVAAAKPIGRGLAARVPRRLSTWHPS